MTCGQLKEHITGLLLLVATKFPERVFFGLEAANKKRERTVLVVNASHLTDILKDWQMDRMPERMFAIEKLLWDARSQ